MESRVPAMRSLKRLGTDYIDLYLLHFPVPTAQFAGVVAAFEKLHAAKKIRAWGVSNFNQQQMEDPVPRAERHALRDESGSVQPA